MTQGQSSRLFHRSLPEGYRDELREMVAEEPPRPTQRERSILLFRLGPLHLALPVHVAFAISPVQHVSRIPHRSGTVLLGLVAFRGEILPCCSLARLLDVTLEETSTARMLILQESPTRLWATPVDAIVSIRQSPQCVFQESAPLSAQWLVGAYADRSGVYHQLETSHLFRQITLATA